MPTVATAIGAFAEYGESVRALSLGCEPEALLAAALKEAATPARRSDARRRYVETHGPDDFCAALLAATPAG